MIFMLRNIYDIAYHNGGPEKFDIITSQPPRSNLDQINHLKRIVSQLWNPFSQQPICLEAIRGYWPIVVRVILYILWNCFQGLQTEKIALMWSRISVGLICFQQAKKLAHQFWKFPKETQSQIFCVGKSQRHSSCIKNMTRISFIKVNCFVSYVVPILQFLNFCRSDSGVSYEKNYVLWVS